MQKRTIVLSLLTIVTMIDSSAWAQVSRNQQEPALQRIGFDQNLDAQLPLDAHFTNDRGEHVTLGSMIEERPVILAPVYYNCPMLCGLIINGLLTSMKEVAFNAGEHYDVVVMSFDPRETAELAAANKQVFLEQYGRQNVEHGIHFLVGEEEQIKRVTETIGFQYEWIPEIEDFGHASGVVLVTPEGRTSRYFYGIMYPARDMRLGLIEAADNKIGNAVDRLLLFCYHYDPATGAYGLLIHRVINLAAVTTATILGLFVFIMIRAEKKRKTTHPNEASEA